MNTWNRFTIGAYARVTGAWNRFKSEERGDTSFISLMIILAIGIIFAIAFIGYGNEIMNAASQRVEDIINMLKGSSSGS